MQRYFSNKLVDNKFVINDDDIYHITKVMRMNSNDKIEVVYENNVYICNLNFVNDKVEVHPETMLENISEKKLEVTLIIPLLKEQKMDLILQKATELGVTEIIPTIMSRSVVKVEKDKAQKKLERWRKICKEASEQSKRTNIPIVTEIKTISELDSCIGLKLVCSTLERKNNLKLLLRSNSNCDRINIAIGPEGGLSLEEEKKLNLLGFTSITLGNRIMRVETVPIYVLSVINYENME